MSWSKKFESGTARSTGSGSKVIMKCPFCSKEFKDGKAMGQHFKVSKVPEEKKKWVRLNRCVDIYANSMKITRWDVVPGFWKKLM